MAQGLPELGEHGHGPEEHYPSLGPGPAPVWEYIGSWIWASVGAQKFSQDDGFGVSLYESTRASGMVLTSV